MFSLMRKLGSHLRTVEGQSTLDQLTDDLGDTYHYGLAFCFDNEGNYIDLKITEGQSCIFYKKGPSRGTDFTLVSKISASKENVVGRLYSNAEKIAEWDSKRGNSGFLSICMEQNDKNRIIETMKEHIREQYPQDANVEKRVFAYWALYENNEIIPLCSTDMVKEYLLEEGLEQYSTRKSTRVIMKEKNGVCSVCGNQELPVYGNFSEVPCYSLDKPGMITGGFKFIQTSRNFPICQICILDVLAAKTYIEKNLNFYLAGLNYWLIPDTSHEIIFRELLEDLKSQKSRQSMGRELKTITHNEMEVFDYFVQLSESKGTIDPITLNLFFYHSKQASWKLIAEVRQVLPSRIKKVNDAKSDIEEMCELKMSKKERENGYFFTLKTIRSFCGEKKKSGEQRFLSYIEAVFKGTSMKWDNLVKDISNGIISIQKRSPNFAPFQIRDGWALYNFLKELKIIQITDGGNTMNEDEGTSNHYIEFMNKNPEFFGKNERRISFLTGAYVGAVLYVQWKIRNSQPFTKKFFGRKLTKDRLIYLYNEGKKKLTQYKRLGIVHDLDPLLAESWIAVGDGWVMSKEDTTFAFNLGWTMASKLAKKIKEDDNKLEVKV